MVGIHALNVAILVRIQARQLHFSLALCYNSFTMAKADYLIKLTYDREYKGYVAECLNLFGCMSQGKTKTEALRNIEKAIKAYMAVVTKQTKGQELSIREVALPHISLSV